MATIDRRAFQLTRVADASTQKALEEARDSANKAEAAPFAHGIKHIIPSLAAGADATIAHKLGKTPSDWVVGDVIGGPNLLMRVSADENYLVLRNTGAVTIGFAVTVFAK